MKVDALTLHQRALLPREERLATECMSAQGGEDTPCIGTTAHYRVHGHGVFTLCTGHAERIALA